MVRITAIRDNFQQTPVYIAEVVLSITNSYNILGMLNYGPRKRVSTM
jgi:hypothetical protein